MNFPSDSASAPRTPYKIFCLGVILFLIQRIAHAHPDPDLFGYLSFGRIFWETGFPYIDTFSYSETLPQWIYHEWLTGVLLYPLWDVNPAFIQALRLLLICSTIMVAYKSASKTLESRLSFFVILFLIIPFFSYGYSPLRAQAFTNLLYLLVILYYFEDQHPLTFIKLLTAGFLFCCWANLHGGFIVGVAMATAGAFYRCVLQNYSFKQTILLLSPISGALVNPYGLKYFYYLYDAITLQRIEIYEWHSVLTAIRIGHSQDVVIHFAALSFAVAVILLLAKPRNSACYIVLGLTFIAACKHLRHQSFFFLAVLFYLPPILPAAFYRLLSLVPPKSKIPLLLRAMMIACIVFFVLEFIQDPPSRALFSLDPSVRMDAQDPTSRYPVDAIAYLQEMNASGNIVTEFHWGEYVMWSLYPDFKIGFDGRYETVYTAKTCELFFDFINTRSDWRHFLREFPTDYILTAKGATLTNTLRDDDAWRIRFENDTAVLFSNNLSAE